jgi:hypothetical protein
MVLWLLFAELIIFMVVLNLCVLILFHSPAILIIEKRIYYYVVDFTPTKR